MSVDERPPRSAALIVPRLSDDQWRELLIAGEIEITGRMPWSSNATFLVSVTAEGVQAPAIYKPEAGERPLRDFPSGLWRREVGAFELSDVLGLRVVPETVERSDGPLGEGSVQRFVDADFARHYFDFLEQPEHREALRVMAGVDLLANNADRKGGHVLIDPDGHLWGIDNGLCFHSSPKLRTVMWDFAGEEVPPEVLELARSITEEFPSRFEELLHPREQQALLYRAEDLLEDPHFPFPDDSHRAYPWPMI